MSIDFFKDDCRDATSEICFGICDGARGAHAFMTTEGRDSWVAIVNNSKSMKIYFHPIDNCIELNRDDGNAEKKCDAMMHYPDNLVFVV